MRVYRCTCNFDYIINDKETKVIGPIYVPPPGYTQVMISNQAPITYKQFAEGYSDCEYRYKLEKERQCTATTAENGSKHSK